jgi:bacterioferritin
MKGNSKVVQMLNEVLVGELTAINQYFLAAKMCHHRGYLRLHEKLYGEALEEMKHAEHLVERILFLGGLPNLQKLDKLRVAEAPPEQLKANLELERQSLERLNGGIRLARESGDNGSAELLEKLLTSAETHVDWLEAQVGLVKQLGDAHYLAQQIKKDG